MQVSWLKGSKFCYLLSRWFLGPFILWRILTSSCVWYTAQWYIQTHSTISQHTRKYLPFLSLLKMWNRLLSESETCLLRRHYFTSAIYTRYCVMIITVYSGSQSLIKNPDFGVKRSGFNPQLPHDHLSEISLVISTVWAAGFLNYKMEMILSTLQGYSMYWMG